MACKHCGQKVTLHPTAAERAKKYGGKPADYVALFPDHAECVVKAREADTVALMRRLGKGLNSDLK